MGLIPEETISGNLPSQFFHDAIEIVAESRSVETGMRQWLACKGAYLAVSWVVSEEKARRFTSKPLSDSPCVKIHLHA